MRLTYTAMLIALTALVVYSSPLYDVVINYTAPLEQVSPDYVLNVGNCTVYVYVVYDFYKPKSPLTLYIAHRMVVYNETKYNAMRNETLYRRLPPLSPGEVRLVLDKLIELLGTDVEVVWSHERPNASSWHGTTRVKARNIQELKDRIRNITGGEVAVHFDEIETFKRAQTEATWVYSVRWYLNSAVFEYDPPNRLKTRPTD